MESKETKAVIFLTMAFMLTQFTTGLYVPVMPAISNYYHVSHKEIMLTISLFLAGFAVGQLFWGVLSDFISRKKLFVIALILYLLESVFLYFKFDFYFYLCFFLFWGFCAAAFTSIGNAIVKDTYSTKKAIAIIGGIGIAMSTGPIIGPFIGAHILSLSDNVKIVFLVLAVYSAINLAGIMFFIDNPKEHKYSLQHSTSFFVALKGLLLNRWYIYYSVSLCVLYGSFIGYVSISAFLFEKYYLLSGSSYGVYYLLSSISCIVGTIINQYLIHRLRVKALVIIGTIVALLGTIFLLIIQCFYSASMLGTLFSISVFMFGFGLIVPSCKAGAMVAHPTHAGLASSIMKFLQVLGGVIFTFIFSLINDSFVNVALLIGLASLLSLLLLLFSSMEKVVCEDKKEHA